MYCDMTYYTNTYGGTTIPSTQFTNLELKVRSYIDNITFNRLQGESVTIPSEVKNAMCEMMEYKYKILNDGGIKSTESVGNTSTSYVVDSTTTEKKEMYKIAKTYLGNTDLLYRGVSYDYQL